MSPVPVTSCNIKNNVINLEQTSNDFLDFTECPVEITSFDQAYHQVKEYYFKESLTSPNIATPSQTELLALTTVYYSEKCPLDQLEDKLLTIVRSFPIPQDYQESKAIQEMRSLYLRFNQPGALRRIGAKEELSNIPILQRLLQNANSTNHRLESLNLINKGKTAKLPQGLLTPPSVNLKNMDENNHKQITLTRDEQVTEQVKITTRNQTFLKITTFVTKNAEDILNGPQTPTQFQLLSANLLKSITLSELLQLSMDDFSQTVASSLRAEILASEEGKSFSTLEQLKLVHIGNCWAQALSTHVGIMIQQSLAERIVQYSMDNISHLNTLIAEETNLENREKYITKLDHQQRIINRLTSKNSTNYLAALDPNLSKEFPIIFTTVLKDYGLPGGTKNNVVQESLKNFKAWKENTDAVYFALGDLAGSLAGGKLVKLLRTSVNFAKNFSKLRSSEPNYTYQECTGRLLVEMAGKELLGELVHNIDYAGGAIIGKAAKLDQDQIELITKQLDFINRHEAGKISKNIIDNF